MTPEQFADAAGAPLEQFAHQCHAASLALVRGGVGLRVLRGSCAGVPGQHSWVLMDTGNDPGGRGIYNPRAIVLDPTRWSYVGEAPYVLQVRAAVCGYVPHGAGSIWKYGRPLEPTGPVVPLTPSRPLSRQAQTFLDLLGPLDRRGWAQLANGPMEGWPAGEVLAAMDDTPEVQALVPVDRLGMLTDCNPGGLYLPGEDKRERKRKAESA
jgi:hypothetical protein